MSIPYYSLDWRKEGRDQVPQRVADARRLYQIRRIVVEIVKPPIVES